MSLKGFLKIFILGCMGLGLCIALAIVRETVSERSQRRELVYQDMAQTTAGSQILAGPYLVLPYEVQNPATAVGARFDVSRDRLVILPKQLTMNGRLQGQTRYRSLYEILLYEAQLRLEGRFEFPEPKDLTIPAGARVRWLQPYAVVLVQDSRGLTPPRFSWNSQAIEVKPGRRDLEAILEGGFHVDLPMGLEHGGNVPFTIDVNLRGMQSFSWIPIGDEMRVNLQANWPHPSFQGRALPTHHKITDVGFEAVWESSQFSQTQSDVKNLKNQEVGVKLIQPVDVYQQTERSVKYGFLFIALTFAAFLLFEVMKSLTIHPVQYGLVGLALVLFYVLLLALSEHIAFVWAYLISSLASLALLAYYIRYVVHSWKHSLGFVLGLALGDAAIYGILLSEDYALLYGACLLFVLLAVAMVVTRRVNWAALTKD